MKAFVVSVVVLVFITALSILNSFIIIGITDELLSELNADSVTDIDPQKVSEQLDKYYFYLGLTVQKQKLERIKENMVILDESVHSKDLLSLLFHPL